MRTESKIKFNFEQVKPLNPLAPYLGGKRILAKTIIPLIEKIPHNIYAEPFVGMGGIFFRRQNRPACEAVNDYNDEVANMFRMVEKFPAYLADMLKLKIYSRAEFKRLLATPPALLTELERAVRFLYIQKIAYGGKTYCQHFGMALDGRNRFDVPKLIDQIKLISQRLSGVYIECLNYDSFIVKYDRKDTLFYLDPPYWNCEEDYGKDIFAKTDFENLANILKNIKGKFILSLNNVPQIKAIFQDFYIVEVDSRYSYSPAINKKVTELLISNINLNNL